MNTQTNWPFNKGSRTTYYAQCIIHVYIIKRYSQWDWLIQHSHHNRCCRWNPLEHSVCSAQWSRRLFAWKTWLNVERKTTCRSVISDIVTTNKLTNTHTHTFSIDWMQFAIRSMELEREKSLCIRETNSKDVFQVKAPAQIPGGSILNLFIFNALSYSLIGNLSVRWANKPHSPKSPVAIKAT